MYPNFAAAAQMWTYATANIGDKILLYDPLWECFLLLLAAMKYCTVHVTSTAPGAYVKALVDQHQSLRDAILTKDTPKMH